MAKDSSKITKSNIQNSPNLSKETTSAELSENWDNLPEERKKAEIAFAIEESWAGPLPSPEDFKMYEDTLPGAAERILCMAESQQQFQREVLLQSSDHTKRRINRSFWVALGLVAVAGIAAWNGFTGIAITLGLGGPISALIRSLIEKIFNNE